MNGSMSNANDSGLGIRESLKQVIGCGQAFVGNLKGSGFNVVHAVLR
jgi:hypothetical protein